MASILSETKKKKKKNTKLSHLKTLGHELLSSRAHINNLPTLLSFVSADSPPQFAVESILSLQSFFTAVLSDLPSAKKKASSFAESQDDPEFIYKTWLRAKFDEFVSSLVEVSVSSQSDETLKEVVFDTLMEFVKLGNDGRLNSAIYHKLIHSIVHSEASNESLLELLVSRYFKYIDVRYFTYISLEKMCRTLEEKNVTGTDGNDNNKLSEGTEQSIQNIHSILSRIPAQVGSVDAAEMLSDSSPLGESDKVSANKKDDKMVKTEKPSSKTESLYVSDPPSRLQKLSALVIAKRTKLKLTKAWTIFLRLPLPLNVYKEVLVNLHQTVIPHHSNPAILCDFLTRSYDIGGVISVMALSSLFLLMTQHGLEYPNFYEKLYALLVPSIFMAKHRAKFFQLLDSCLKSSLLPAYLAAAFAKRLSRLSVSVPPSGSLVIVVLIHNLLRRHPSINCLVHREDDGTAKNDSESVDETVKKLGIDRFNNEESDPKKSHAMSSSLWEIDTLRHHYCPPVSRFVLSLENDLTVRAKTTEISIEDFSSGSYATIFGDEIRRRVKQVPLAFYKVPPTSLYSESEFTGWSFKTEDTNEIAELKITASKRQRT